jgi:hypothetical protein
MRRQAAISSYLRPKTTKKPINMAKYGQNPEKTCGNRAFCLDFACSEAAL